MTPSSTPRSLLETPGNPLGLPFRALGDSQDLHGTSENVPGEFASQACEVNLRFKQMLQDAKSPNLFGPQSDITCLEHIFNFVYM